MSVQGSPEWFAERCGRVTASRVADVIARTKSGYSSSRDNYMAELLVERLTGQPVPTYSNAAMQRGSELEPEARVAYELLTGYEVEQIGFVPHPLIAQSGASPDGLIGADGLVEIKCPNTATHLDTLLQQAVPKNYLTQMQWQMACTKRDWCDYVSYDPRLPAHLSLYIARIERNDLLIVSMGEEVSLFLKELAEKLEALSAKYPTPKAA